MTAERRDFLNACWLAGMDPFEASCHLEGRRILIRDLLKISEIFEANETLLASIAGNVTVRGVQFDRRVK